MIKIQVGLFPTKELSSISHRKGRFILMYLQSKVIFIFVFCLYNIMGSRKPTRKGKLAKFIRILSQILDVSSATFLGS